MPIVKRAGALLNASVLLTPAMLMKLIKISTFWSIINPTEVEMETNQDGVDRKRSVIGRKPGIFLIPFNKSITPRCPYSSVPTPPFNRLDEFQIV